MKNTFKTIFCRGTIAAVIVLSVLSLSYAQDNKHNSFGEQNSKKLYTSFAFGMGLNYGSSGSLDTYIGYELPNYNFLNESSKLSQFRSGFDFFITGERQFHRNFSIKADYSYFIKSNDVALYPDYGFNIASHRIFVVANYIIPMDYAFLKLGAGAGPEFSTLTQRFSSLESVYNSSGFGIKAEGTFDIQIGKNAAGYINGYLMNIFDSGLKNQEGKDVLNRAGGKADLSGFSLGLRVGVEFFIF